MNLTFRADLDELKEVMDEVFGESVLWVSESGGQQSVDGIFNRLDKEVSARPSNQKRESGLSVDYVDATFSVKPDLALMQEGDVLICEGVSYSVLKYKTGKLQAIIPLKVKADKDHSWR